MFCIISGDLKRQSILNFVIIIIINIIIIITTTKTFTNYKTNYKGTHYNTVELGNGLKLISDSINYGQGICLSLF